MSAEAVRRFWKDVDAVPALRDSVEALFSGGQTPQASAASIVGVAAKHGYEFTVDELKQHVAANAAELSDAELEAVSGGGAGATVLPVKGGMVMIN